MVGGGKATDSREEFFDSAAGARCRKERSGDLAGCVSDALMRADRGQQRDDDVRYGEACRHVENPLRQIDQPPAHHAMNCRDRAPLDHVGDGLTLEVIELGRVTR
jgi:hypothetical protein